MRKVTSILAIVAASSLVSACALFRATGQAVEATGEGAGHAVQAVGEGGGHAISETGRAVERAADDVERKIR